MTAPPLGALMTRSGKSLPPKAKSSVGRRSFLQALGGLAGATAVVANTDWAKAGNGWTLGLTELPKDKLIDMYTKMLKSRWWEEGIKEEFLSGKDQALWSFPHLHW